MSDRTPYDGLPYYCAECGCGFAEFLACDEESGCHLESRENAEMRRKQYSQPDHGIQKASQELK